MKKKLSIKEVAKEMNKSEQFVRVGLQNGVFPFGTAVKLSNRYSYHISPQKFYEYMGKEYQNEEEI